MKNRAVFVVLLALTFPWIGCAVSPGWVQHDQHAFFSERDAALYGIGVGRPEEGEIRHALARLKARRSLADAKRQYVTDFLKRFTDDHPEWFKHPAINDTIDDIAGNVIELTFHPVKPVITEWEDTRYLPWEDRGGVMDGKGTAYAMVRQNVDTHFFDAVYDAASRHLEAGKDEVLKTNPDTVLSELAKSIEAGKERLGL